MTFKNFICKGVLVFTALLLIGWLGQYIYMVNGEIDWFRLMLVYGVPVGIPHMFIIVPWHWDLSGILGMRNCRRRIWMCDCSRSGSQSDMVHSRLPDQQNAGQL